MFVGSNICVKIRSQFTYDLISHLIFPFLWNRYCSSKLQLISMCWNGFLIHPLQKRLLNLGRSSKATWVEDTEGGRTCLSTTCDKIIGPLRAFCYDFNNCVFLYIYFRLCYRRELDFLPEISIDQWLYWRMMKKSLRMTRTEKYFVKVLACVNQWRTFR